MSHGRGVGLGARTEGGGARHALELGGKEPDREI